jgi:hypothetical protein
MKNNVKLSPKQLRELTERLVKFYEHDFTTGKTKHPHYEHVSIDDHMFKIGYYPSDDNTPIIMNIRIVYKGKTNG